jgi:hypothetical protein
MFGQSNLACEITAQCYWLFIDPRIESDSPAVFTILRNHSLGPDFSYKTSGNQNYKNYDDTDKRSDSGFKQFSPPFCIQKFLPELV